MLFLVRAVLSDLIFSSVAAVGSSMLARMEGHETASEAAEKTFSLSSLIDK